MTAPAVRRVTLLASALVALGPLSTSHALLDKTRFVAHVGVAYYAFHHWVLTPYRAGQFAAGAAGRTRAFAKGGLALLFAAHEVNVAEKVAHGSRDPLLQKLDGELVKLRGSLTAIGNRAKAGQLTDADIQSLDDTTTQIGRDSAAGGQPIRDVQAAIPGL